MPFSILAALEDSICDLSTRKRLSIFLIGAGAKELEGSWVFEELLHLLPTVQTLNIMLIGPGVTGVSDFRKGNVSNCRNCSSCNSLNKKRLMGIYGGIYHDYVKESYYEKPDLAVLFHSGRSQVERESWAPTTRFLVDSDTPTLCTTWTQREAHEEAEELNQLEARFIVRPKENKWRSLVPILDFLEGADDEVYHVNYYRYIFQGR